MLKVKENKEFLTVKELAEALKVSRITVFKRIKRGEIKAAKAGRNFIIFKKDIPYLFAPELSNEIKKEIEAGVKRAIEEYGDVLKKLGKE